MEYKKPLPGLKTITMPKISILLPTYNGGLYIEEAIKSVLGQTYQDWELLILDDASTDNTEQISTRYSKIDHRIIYIKNERNLRLAKNLNKGLLLSSGEIIARIDEDDTWIDTNKLKKQAGTLITNNSVLVGTHFEIVDDKNNLIRTVTPPLDDNSIRKIILSYNPFCHSSVIFDKKSAIRVGGYNDKIPYGEDYDLWLKLGRLGTLSIIPSIAVKYLQRDGNMSSKHNKLGQIKFICRILYTHAWHYPNKIKAFLSFIKYIVSK